MPIEVSENGNMQSTFLPHSAQSEAIQEFISRKPGFLIQYGIVLFLVILILITVACWFIQYPDVIAAPAKLTSINPPKPVVTHTGGKLVKLFVKEGTPVKANDLIGYMENTADIHEVLRLSGNLDSVAFALSENKLNLLQKYFLNSFNSLGDLQQSYQTFMQAFIEFKNYTAGGFFLNKQAILYADMEHLKNMHQNLLQQKDLQEQDLQLSQKTFEANDLLKKEKVISDLEYRNEKSKLLNKTIIIPQINASIISNENQQNDKQKEILELENTMAQQKIIFQQALNTMKSETDEWNKKYLLVAPVSGTVSFTGFLQENQELQANQVICYINTGNSSYYAEIFISQSNFGKIKKGQKVLLKFPAYPDAEYGSVVGQLDFISNVPSDSGYVAKVNLPDGLNTNYGKRIQYRDGLIASAEIITQNLRLLQRFYYDIYKNIKN
jgi:HlyD family secretion protein